MTSAVSSIRANTAGLAANTWVHTASSMIAVGLSWKMAIGACVLGNTVMGIVITVNGRMGAIVSFCTLPTRPSGADPDLAAHSVPRASAYALRLLLQLLRRPVPLRARYCVARVSLSDQSVRFASGS